MAGHGDIQELLRIFTSRKVSMIGAMGHLKALQAQNLKTIEQIAQAEPAAVEGALKDAKLAKSVQAACKSHGKQGGQKRGAEDPTSPTSKRSKLEPTKYDLDYASMSPDELESSLTLPLIEDEDAIRSTSITTNRAPLVLAFAVELLRCTMPEQPPSSRLSLSQAVVSANSRSKAVSLGIEKASGNEIQLSDGQPKVRVMGREIPVLKRADYKWSGTESEKPAAAIQPQQVKTPNRNSWTTSQTLTSRASTFVAHAITISSAAQRSSLMKQLMSDKPNLETADHNAWAIRTSFGGSPLVQEASFDDGEGGCGKFMLGIMRESNVTNTLVVLTRWYGGIMLGPDRWRLMRECVNDAISSLRRTSSFSGEAVWGLDLQDTKIVTATVGMAIHRPEGARNYLLRAFPSSPSQSTGPENKLSASALNDQKQENLGKLLGALRLLYSSWKDTLSSSELDRRAWGWYVAVRPDVESGPSGWGAKGSLNLGKILDLRRHETKEKG